MNCGKFSVLFAINGCLPDLILLALRDGRKTFPRSEQKRSAFYDDFALMNSHQRSSASPLTGFDLITAAKYEVMLSVNGVRLLPMVENHVTF
jgi:hypothetical protein